MQSRTSVLHGRCSLTQTNARLCTSAETTVTTTYTLPGRIARIPISETNLERDLGIIITPNFKFSEQSSHAASKANKILSILKHTFVSRDVEIWTTLNRAYIRPHLEFAISVWNPFLRRDIATLEKVQRRVTRLPTVLRGLSYNERMSRMSLTSLEIRRICGDLIQLYKVKNNLDLVAWHSPPTWSDPRPGRREQLRREIVSACQQRHNFFLNRVAPLWNSLPDDTARGETMSDFKSRLDKFLNR